MQEAQSEPVPAASAAPLIPEGYTAIQQDPGGAWAIVTKTGTEGAFMRMHLPDGSVQENPMPEAAVQALEMQKGSVAAGGVGALLGANGVGMSSTMQHVVEAEAAIGVVAAGASLLKGFFTK